MKYLLILIAIIICCSMESFCKDAPDSIWIKKASFSNSYYLNGLKISFAKRDSLLKIYTESADLLRTAKYYKYGATSCYLIGGLSGIVGIFLMSDNNPGKNVDYSTAYSSLLGVSALFLLGGTILTAQKNIYILKSIEIFNSAEKEKKISGTGFKFHIMPTGFGLCYNY